MRTRLLAALLPLVAAFACEPGTSAAPATTFGLTVAPERPLTGYTREHFPHWIGQGGSCDTREVVLRRQGADVRTDADCRAVAGTWTSVYDGAMLTDAAGIDIDHLVPLAEAWRSGADTWTGERRRTFANDLDRPQLVAVTARSNRAKGDQDPAKWKPPARTYWCAYARDWIAVKTAYGLTADQAEHDALTAMLVGCAN